MKIEKLLLLFVALGSLASAPVSAQPICQDFGSEARPAHFETVFDMGRELGTAICLTIGRSSDAAELTRQFVDFADEIERQVELEFAGKDFLEALRKQTRHFRKLAQAGVDKGRLPSFGSAVTRIDGEPIAFFNFQDWNTQGEANLESEQCQQTGKPSCKALFEALEVAIEQYKTPYQRESAKAFTDQVELLGLEWDRYFEQARAQTLWDAVLTTVMEQDHLAQDRLVAPMDRQWFLVHPSLVIENVSDAIDGDEVAAALAVEWIGVNWWNENSSPIGYPFGISLVSTYSDRVSVKESGHGLMLHFNNSMSVGLTDHDGDSGVFVTVDMLGLLAQKKQRLKDYRSRVEDLVAERIAQEKAQVSAAMDELARQLEAN